jgi:predicted metalloprotease
MDNRGRNRRRPAGARGCTAVALPRAAIACAAAILVVAGCTTFVEGRALSMLNDPFRVGGLPATNGPSGIRPNAPSPSGTVVNTDNGTIDKLSLLSVNDIEDYWKSVYSESLKGTFLPVQQSR